MAHKRDLTFPLEALGVSDSTDDCKIIKKQLHLAIIRGFTKAVQMTIEYAKRIVPESHPGDKNIRDPPYPPSYETEQLMNTYIDALSRSLTKLIRGRTTLRKEYTIQQLGWDDVSYAEMVNDMKGVNWTKATSEGGFIEKLCRFLKATMSAMVALELQAIDRGQQLLYGDTYTSGAYTAYGSVTSG